MDGNLFIGLIDGDIATDDQFSDGQAFRINKIGGYSVLRPNASKQLVTSFESLVCDSCRKRLTQVLQISCPVDDSVTDRLIYLFVCLNCPNKWLAIRTITSCAEVSQSATNSGDVWIDGETDWGEDSMEDNDHNTVTCVQSLANLSVQCSADTNNQSIPVTSTAFFRPLYVSVIAEPEDHKRSDDKHINGLIESYEKSGNQSSDPKAGGSGEVYEQNFLESIYGNDRKNYEFFKRLSNCPKQVIRYEWMGTPLINSDKHKTNVSKCLSCGSDRVFEFQLMPALISYLRPSDDSQPIPDLDFGTILVFTCAQNCRQSEEQLTIEQTIVLTDPDNDLCKELSFNHSDH